MAHIDFLDGRYVGVGTYDERLLWKAAGFRWNGLRKAWVAPSLEVALRVPNLLWTDRAADEAEASMQSADFALEMSHQADTDFQPPCPAGIDPRTGKPKAFLPYQRAGIEYALGRRDTLIGDAPGLGKTAQAIGVANCERSTRKVLIIVPASLKENWRREWLLWSTRTELSVGIAETQHTDKVRDGTYKNGKPRYRTVTTPAYWPDTDVVIINYDILDRFAEINDTVWDYLIVDECHALKSDDSKRTLLVLGGMKRPTKGEVAQRIKEREEAIAADPAVARTQFDPKKPTWFTAVDASRRVFLSGTPMLNRPIEFWPIVHAFDPDELGANKEAFGYRYCGAFRTHYGLDYSGASNLVELGDKVRAKFMVRRLKKDVLPELPETRRIIVTLDSPEIRQLVAREDELAQALKLYEAMVKSESLDEAEARQGAEILKRTQLMGFDDAFGDPEDPTPNAHALKMEYAEAVLGLEPPMVAVAFEEIAQVRREIGLAKLSAVVPWVHDYLAAEEKLLIFAYHSDVVLQLVEQLAEYNPAFVYGGVPLKKRQGQVDLFQEDPNCRVFVGNIHAAGVGFTLTRGKDVAFAEQDWTPTLMQQCEDRVNRIGQLAQNLFAYYLVANGSLDARIVQSAKTKQDNITLTVG